MRKVTLEGWASKGWILEWDHGFTCFDKIFQKKEDADEFHGQARKVKITMEEVSEPRTSERCLFSP